MPFIRGRPVPPLFHRPIDITVDPKVTENDPTVNPDHIVSQSHNVIKTNNLLFYIDRIISYQRLYILLLVVKDILKLVYKDGHPGFEKCFKNISRS